MYSSEWNLVISRSEARGEVWKGKLEIKKEQSRGKTVVTYEDIELIEKIVTLQKVVRHPHTVRLHWMALRIVEVAHAFLIKVSHVPSGRERHIEGRKGSSQLVDSELDLLNRVRSSNETPDCNGNGNGKGGEIKK